MLTPGQAADTRMMVAALEQNRVPVGPGRPRTRTDRVIADKRSPSKANWAWLRQHGIAVTIPEPDDLIAHRRKKSGRPINFGEDQRTRYRGRNVVDRCFNKLKQWRGIAMGSDKTALRRECASLRRSNGCSSARRASCRGGGYGGQDGSLSFIWSNGYGRPASSVSLRPTTSNPRWA
ncbi:transposase family protein [Pseudoclavibacter terrae]